jgi:hypothetical protein
MQGHPSARDSIEFHLRNFLAEEAAEVPETDLARFVHTIAGRRHRQRMQLIGAATGILVAASAVTISFGLIGDSGSPSPSASVPSSTNYATDSTANAEAQAVLEDFLTPLDESDDATFAGAWIGPEGIFVGVVNDSPSSLLAEALNNAIKSGIPVHTRGAQYSLVQMRALVRRISGDLSYWRGRGVEISTVGTDVTTNSVVVTLESYEQASVAAISAHYPSEPIVVPPTSVGASAS